MEGGFRLRIATALAVVAPDDPHWSNCAGELAEQLLAEDGASLSLWLRAFEPVRKYFLVPLSVSFRSPNDPRARVLATVTDPAEATAGVDGDLAGSRVRVDADAEAHLL